MQVNYILIKPALRLYLVFNCILLYIVKGNLRRFFHNIAHLSGQDKSALAVRETDCFYKKSVASHACPGKANASSRNFGPFDFAFVKNRLAKISIQIFCINIKLFSVQRIAFVIFDFFYFAQSLDVFRNSRKLPCNYLSVNFINTFFVIADTGLARIFLCDTQKSGLCIFYLAFCKSVFCKIFWNKVFSCNFKFLLIDITRKLDYFGAV